MVKNFAFHSKKQTTINSKRIEWVDIVKYVCIIMVMLSHLEMRTEIWHTFFTPFFLNAFLFVSGYVYKTKESFLKHLCAKLYQLFVPWLVFSLLILTSAQILSFNVHESLSEELIWNLLQIRGSGDELWFVAALFVTFIPFYFFIKRFDNTVLKEQSCSRKRCKCCMAIAIAWLLSFISILYIWLMPADVFPWKSNALPWHLEYIFRAMFYMVLGYAFRYFFEMWFDRHNTLSVRVFLTILYLLLVYVPFFGNVKMPMIVDILYEYFLSIVGISTLVLISKAVKSNSYINFVGQNTLIYFALHGKAYSLIQMLWKRILPELYSVILGSTVYSTVFSLLFALALSFLLIPPTYIINRFFPFIAGRKVNGR